MPREIDRPPPRYGERLDGRDRARIARDLKPDEEGEYSTPRGFEPRSRWDDYRDTTTDTPA